MGSAHFGDKKDFVALNLRHGFPDIGFRLTIVRNCVKKEIMMVFLMKHNKERNESKQRE